jgi:hypothetical protein
MCSYPGGSEIKVPRETILADSSCIKMVLGISDPENCAGETDFYCVAFGDGELEKTGI